MKRKKSQGRCEQRSEAFVKIQKKNYYYFFILAGGASRVGGVRVEGNGEVRLV